jgi:hypothetical protein
MRLRKLRIAWPLVLLAVGIVLLCAAYFLLISPTLNAARLVAGINDASIDVNGVLKSHKVHVPMIELATKAHATLLPCTKNDLLTRQRRVKLIGTMTATTPAGKPYPGELKVHAEVGMNSNQMWRIDSDVELVPNSQ